MLLSRPRVWSPRRQPSWPLSINRQHPLARDLIAAWPFLPAGGGTLYDVGGYGLDGVLVGMAPASDWSGTNLGMGLHFDGVAGEYVDISASANSVDPTDGSICLIARFEGGSESDGVAHSLLEVGDATDDANFIGCRKTAADSVLIRYRRASVNNDAIIGIVAGSTWLQIVGVWNATDVIAYINGVRADTANRGADIAVAFDQAAIGGQGQGGGANKGNKVFVGPMILACIFSRSLSDDEVMALYEDPWAVFRPRRSSSLNAITTALSRNYYCGGNIAAKRVAGRGMAW